MQSLYLFLAQVSRSEIILKTPIIGDIFYVLATFMIPLFILVFLLYIEIFARFLFKKQILFFKVDKVDSLFEYIKTGNYNIWLCLLIAINSLVIRYSFKDLDSETLNSFNASQTLLFIGWSLGLVPAFIAYKKGRCFLNWWMYGHLLFIVAFPHALLLKETEDSLINRGVLKKCLYCAEVVKKEAKVCKHCGNQLN